MINRILENFKVYCPGTYKRMKSYTYDGRYSITTELDDGSRYIYNDLEHGTRKLPNNKDNMSEEEYRQEFGYRLRSIMNDKAMTQSMLSERTGIPQPQLSTYVNGKCTASSYTVRKIAQALNCSVDELLYL